MIKRGRIEIKKHNTFNVKFYIRDILIIIALSLGLSAIGVILSDVLDMITIKRYLAAPGLYLLNTIPLFLLLLFIYNLTSRVWLSFGLGGGLFLLMQIVNNIMMQLREEPFAPSDIALGMEAANVIKLKELPISLFMICSVILFILFGVYLFFFVKKHQIIWPVKVVGAVFAVIIFLVANNNYYKSQQVYNSFKVTGSIYSNVNQYKSHGFIYSFIYKANNFKYNKPEGYTKDEAEQLLKENQKTVDNTKGKKMPNVIAVMGEAFYDIDRIPGIEFNDNYNPLENFHKIASEGYSGRIVTSVFGGGTSETEFSFLTGHSMALNTNTGSPYTSYIRRDTFSLARVFEKSGYETMAFHPGDAWFYNRNNVYQFFGFDNKYFKNSMDLSKVTMNYGYISDRDAYEFLLGKFKEHISSKPATPFFQFMVTINNHGPYSSESLGNPEILKRKDNMSPEAYYTVNNYINGLMRCDKALGYLTQSLEETDEPVVLIFYADHLPFLGKDAMGYKALNYDISQTEGLDAFLKQYETPYIIWSNKAAKDLLAQNNVQPLSGKAPIISPNYLATELLKYIGLDGGAYFNYIAKTREELPVITSRFYEENGSFTENLSAKSKELLEQYKRLQYYMMMDKGAVNP